MHASRKPTSATLHLERRFQLSALRLLVLALLVCLMGSTSLAQTLRVGLGYLPNIQFAPFYAAQTEGYYEDEGLQVEFQHGFSTELFPLLAQDKLDVVISDAEDAILLRAQDPEGAPFVYVMALYQRVPNAVFSLADKELTTPAALAGKTLGIPGLFGTSYTALQAVLRAGGLSERDLDVQQIGFTQLEAVVSGRVDAALGFINNEPIILSEQGLAINVIPVGPLSPALGSGVITSASILEGDPARIQSFLRATKRGLEATIRSPDTALAASLPFVPELTGDAAKTAREVLNATIPLYTSPYSHQHGLGAINPVRWDAFITLLKDSGRLTTNLPANAFYSNDYLPE